MDLKRIGKEILNDPTLSKLSKLAREKNVPLFLVGGHIRDHLLGRLRLARKDYDLTLPKEISSFIPSIEEALNLHFFQIGKEEMDTLTYRAIKEDMSIDLTLFQGDTIDDDLQRRDFTMNAVAFSLRDETFSWVEGAMRDIEKRVIRRVSPHSIDQDPLRMLRAVRYLCTLDGFDMDTALKEEISQKKDLSQKLPRERIKMELDYIFLSPRPAVGMKFLCESSLLLTLFPELKALITLGQNERHHLNVLSHILLVIEKIPWAYEWITLRQQEIPLTQEDWLTVYYAALFHDIGKQDTYSKDEKGRVHFYYHESFSSQRAERIMEKLRFSNSMRNRILRLVQSHMRILNLPRETQEGALKRLAHQMGDETQLLVLLTLADKEASRGILSIQMDEVVEDHCLQLLRLFKEKEIVHPPPLVTGHDVMAMGYLAGPKVGQILNFIRVKQVEGEIKTREEALQVLKMRFALDHDEVR